MGHSHEGCIPASALRGLLDLERVDALLREHGGCLRSVDNHHWQVCNGERSALWLLGDGAGRPSGGLDPEALQRLQGALRQTGLLDGQEAVAAPGAPMQAAILWVGTGATRVYWINEQGLAGRGSSALGHWLHGEITVHRDPQVHAYLGRILALLERIERALLLGHRAEAGAAGRSPPATLPGLQPSGAGPAEAEGGSLGDLDHLTRLLEEQRPDLRRRVVGILSLASDHLDDALLFSMAQHYLLPLPKAFHPTPLQTLTDPQGRGARS